MEKKSTIFSKVKLWRDLTQFYVSMGAEKGWVWFSILLGAVSLFANVLSFVFLIPLLQGMITKNFDFLSESPLIKYFFLFNPNVLNSFESRFVFLVSIVFALALTRSLALYFSRVIAVRQVYVVDNKVKEKLFEKYLSFNKNFFDKYSTGSIYYTLMDESKRVSKQLQNLMELCLKVLTLTAYFSLLVSISLKLSVVTLVVFGIMGVFANNIVEKVKAAIQKFHYYEKKISDRTHDTILCIPTVKVFGKERQEMEFFRQTNNNTTALAVEGQILSQVINPVKEVFSLVALLLIAFALSLFQDGFSGGNSISEYLVFFMIVRFSSPIFNQMSQNWVSISTADKSLANLRGIIENASPKYQAREGEHSLPAIIHQISFQNVDLQLGKRSIFEKLNFDIPIGKRVALVGASGIGKTTIVNLLMREYDLDKGRLLLDGKDIYDYTAESVKRQFSVVAQDSFLFETTIRKNLIYGAQTSVTDQDIQTAIERSQLSGFIDKLPDGLETVLGERGTTVSGGEKQRIVIARAFLRNSPIMIFDEPTSSLDGHSEEMVKEAIFATTLGRTALIITHKLHVIQDVDQVILLTADGLTLSGSFAALLEMSEEFSSAWHQERQDRYKLTS